MSTHSPSTHSSTATGSPFDASPDARTGPGRLPRRRRNAATNGARAAGIGQPTCWNVTQHRMSDAVVGVVARTRRNRDTATIGRSSGMNVRTYDRPDSPDTELRDTVSKTRVAVVDPST